MPMPLTIEDNHKSLDVQFGDTIEIQLPGNPSTGYSWSRLGFEGKDSHSDDHMEVKIKYSPRHSSGGMVGAGGTYNVSVTPKHSGLHTMDLIYCRSFEGPKHDSKKFKVHLNVA
ncbi:hypothetical protein JKF63_05659 [Porcisia hertigi]|uniref:Proteinase inhibitor I42 chagasin domain-containing protein n=1 Tax=Porcisia hertigi TaxID=2761500 RepID=A0A836I247_9TRYP|nr:hypothetical protein JKF63_05659 [Porcisia hertigi]